MTDDLVARLRDMCGRDGILKCRDIYDTDVVAAADRIEELEAVLLEIANAAGDPSAYWIARTALEKKDD